MLFEAGRDILHIHARWLEDGFTLEGEVTMTWSPVHTPRNSQLALQMGWGQATADWR